MFEEKMLAAKLEILSYISQFPEIQVLCPSAIWEAARIQSFFIVDIKFYFTYGKGNI